MVSFQKTCQQFDTRIGDRLGRRTETCSKQEYKDPMRIYCLSIGVFLNVKELCCLPESVGGQ